LPFYISASARCEVAVLSKITSRFMTRKLQHGVHDKRRIKP